MGEKEMLLEEMLQFFDAAGQLNEGIKKELESMTLAELKELKKSYE